MPFHFMPPIKSGQLGPIYEFREYQLAVGGIKKSIDGWEKALPARQKISPIVIKKSKDYRPCGRIFNGIRSIKY